MKNASLVTLGQRIKERRKMLRLTQEALAAVTEIDRSYMGGVERGERNITFTKLGEIASGLQCDIAALTHGLPLAEK